jgi:hypothetical protein
VYWDSKLLPDLTRRDTIDRLPVIITAPYVEQLLGVLQLLSGSGNEICSAVYNTLNQRWPNLFRSRSTENLIYLWRSTFLEKNFINQNKK